MTIESNQIKLQKGDKILLPPSAFDTLARLQVDYPMLFRLTQESGQSTHCGVMEFTAEEGTCYIPFWMMQNLLLSEGGQVELRSILHPPPGSFVRFRPHDDTFLNMATQQVLRTVSTYSMATTSQKKKQ